MKVFSRVYVIVAFVALLVLLSFDQIPVYASFSWSSLGGATVSSPGVTGIYDLNSGNHLRIDVVVRGSDNGVYHRYFTWAGGWSNWISLNGKTLDQPAVAYAKYKYRDTLHVVVRGLDNALYYKKFDIANGTWDSSWEQMGPGATIWYAQSAPVLINAGHAGSSGSDSLLLFIRGADNFLYYGMWHDYWSYAGKTWLMGLTSDTPAVMVSGEKIHLVVRGTDDGIYYINGSLFYLPGTPVIDWSVRSDGSPVWQKLPGLTISAPTLASYLDDFSNLHLVVRGSNNVIYQNAYNTLSNTWWGWHSLGGLTNARPAVWACWGPVNTCVIYVYVKGTDNVIYRQDGYWLMTYQGWVWTWEPNWTPMDGTTLSAPAIGEGNLVVRGTDNVPYLITQPA